MFQLCGSPRYGREHRDKHKHKPVWYLNSGIVAAVKLKLPKMTDMRRGQELRYQAKSANESEPVTDPTWPFSDQNLFRAFPSGRDKSMTLAEWKAVAVVISTPEYFVESAKK